MPAPYEYDLIVFGSGPAGQRAAVQAAKLKKKVLVVERDGVGGACLHLGTVPSKTLREAALAPDCSNVDPLRGVMERKEKVIQAEAEVIRAQLKRNGVEFVQGTGSFLSPHEILADGPSGEKRASGRFVVLATGTRPSRDPKISYDGERVFDSDTVLRIPKLPRRMMILGAGVIGCEYASIFARLGVSVTLMDRRTGLLRSVDEEIVETLSRHFAANGVTVRMGCFPERIERKGDTIHASAAGEALETDALLWCMGREGNSKDLGLANAGLSANDRGLIAVNEHYQTTVPHIYAVGDLIGAPALAASSAEQGRLAAVHAFELGPAKFPESFPYGIYTIPEISSVGVQESELKEKNVPYVVGRAFYKELARGKILNDDHGFLKLLVHRETRKILGVHVIGTGATELVHIGQVALALGADIEFLVTNVFNYPTLAEAYKVAAYAAFNQLRS